MYDYKEVKPRIKYPMTASAPQISEYGSWVFTWSMWSAPAPVDAKIVVSDSGEQWSPNTPPPATAAKQATTSVVIVSLVYAKASGSAIGMQIAKVPHEDPVAKAMTAATTKMIAGSTAGDKKLSQFSMI